MIYEVRARLFFDEEDEARDFYHDCELAFAKSTIVNPDTQNEEAAIIDLIKNYHDQDPNSSCYLLSYATNATTPPD